MLCGPNSDPIPNSFRTWGIGLVFKTKVFCRSWRHFPISSVFMEKINFWKYLGGVQSFRRLFSKRKAKGKQRPEATNRKSNVQTTQNPFSSFPRQSLTHAQMLFSSVGRYLIFLSINKCNKVRKMALNVDSPLESPPIAVFRGLRFIYWWRKT